MQSYLVNDFLPPTILKEADNGNLVGKARIARVGVQKYVINGELCNVLRDPNDVATTINLFNDLPLTLNHPSENDGGEVNSQNAERLTVGYGSKVTFRDGWLETDVNIVAKRAKEAAKTTHRSFSNGYKINLIPEQGVFDGIPYQYKQQILAGNHIALVPTGTARAGDGATFIVDSAEIDGVILDNIQSTTKETKPMYSFKDMSSKLMDMGKACGYNDIVEVEIGEEKHQLPKDMGKMMDMYGSYMSEKATKKMQDSVDFVEVGIYTAAQNQITALDSKIKQLNEANTRLVGQLAEAQSDQRINDMFTERSTAYEEAKPFLGDTPFSPSVAAAEWKRKALAAKKIACDAFSDAEVNAAFVAIKAIAPQQPTSSPVADSLKEQLAAIRVGDSAGSTFCLPSVLPQHRVIN